MRNKNQRSVRDLLNLRLICTIFVGAKEVRGGQVITMHLSWLNYGRSRVLSTYATIIPRSVFNVNWSWRPWIDDERLVSLHNFTSRIQRFSRPARHRTDKHKNNAMYGETETSATWPNKTEMLVTRRPMGAKYGTPHRTSAVDANPAPTTTNLLTEPLPKTGLRAVLTVRQTLLPQIPCQIQVPSISCCFDAQSNSLLLPSGTFSPPPTPPHRSPLWLQSSKHKS